MHIQKYIYIANNIAYTLKRFGKRKQRPLDKNRRSDIRIYSTIVDFVKSFLYEIFIRSRLPFWCFTKPLSNYTVDSQERLSKVLR